MFANAIYYAVALGLAVFAIGLGEFIHNARGGGDDAR